MGRRLALFLAGILLLLWALYLMVQHPVREPFIFSRPAMIRIPGANTTLGSRAFSRGPEPAEHTIKSFWMCRHEITVGEFTEFLNDGGLKDFESPQVRRHRERYAPIPGREHHPVAYVSHAQAEAYTEWLGQRYQVSVRLPTEQEWEYAARGGIQRARYPWGWGMAEGRAHFAADGPRPVGSFSANPYGLHDMAGNVFEWCVGEGDHRPARGGSWAERDANFLRVFHRVEFPPNYRDADLGFRVVAEKKRVEGEAAKILKDAGRTKVMAP